MRITANQVTLARLLLMPALCSLIYGTHTQRWWAFALGVIIGATDFVDGYLARKQGPTVLGGLMDPIADKVFIAVAFVPFADVGWIAWQLIAALFLREYLVTALRSGFERRGKQLASSYLGKVKTWTQMTTLAMAMLLVLIESRVVLMTVFVALAVVPLVLGVTWHFVKKRKWPGAFIGTVMHGAFAGIYWVWGADAALTATMVACVALTWISGADYLAAAAAVIKQPTLFDASRVLPAIALPLVGMFALVHGQAPVWTVMTVLGVEFAHGGLDNHLAHHDAAAPWWVWGGRLVVIVGALGATLIWPEQATSLGALAAAVSVAGAAATFWSRRRYYIEPKLRDKKRAVQPA